MNILNDLKEILDADYIDENSILSTIDTYDSLAKITIVSLIEEKYKIFLKKEDFDSFVTVSDILNKIKEI